MSSPISEKGKKLSIEDGYKFRFDKMSHAMESFRSFWEKRSARE